MLSTVFHVFLVLQARSDLTDHYYEELQEMKTRHALDLEQHKAKLSESHLQGTTDIEIFFLKSGAVMKLAKVH